MRTTILCAMIAKVPIYSAFNCRKELRFCQGTITSSQFWPCKLDAQPLPNNYQAMPEIVLVLIFGLCCGG